MPKPAASFGREADASCADARPATRRTSAARARPCSMCARRHCSDPGVTSVTVSALEDDLDRIAGESPASNGSGAVGAGASRANFAASSIVSRSCCGAHGFVRKAKHLALVDRALDGVEVGIARQQNAHGPRRKRANLRQHLDARHLRHPVVRHDDVDVLVTDDVERLGTMRSEEQIELAAEHDPHRVQHALLVVDEQEPRPVR